MKYIISVFIILQLFSPYCYGAAENNQESALIDLIGVAGKKGMLAVEKRAYDDGDFICTYAHMLEDQVTGEQLKELAVAMLEDFQQGKRERELIYSVLSLDRRTFLKDRAPTHIALGAFFLRNRKTLFYTTSYAQGCCLYNGDVTAKSQRISSSARSGIDVSKFFNKALWIKGYHEKIEFSCPTGKTLDEVAKEVFDTHEELQPEGVVVVIHADEPSQQTEAATSPSCLLM